jgi:phage I-like protein
MPKAKLFVAACALALSEVGGLHLIPAGRFDGPASEGEGPWYLDEAAALRLIAAAQAQGLQIPVDYEHQTLNAADNGAPAPAAGWIDPNSLIWDPVRGLVATAVQWTERARAMLEAGEYKYLSPVFTYDKADGTVLALLHAALTNTPALNQLDPVTLQAAATRFQPPQEAPNAMNEEQLAALRAALGLPDDADADALLAAAKQLKSDHDTAAAALTRSQDEVAALKAGNPDPAKFAPISLLEEQAKTVAALKAKQDGDEIDGLVQRLIDEKKIKGGEEAEDWARDLGKKDVAALKRYVDIAVPIASLVSNQTGGKGNETDTGADDAETAEKRWGENAALRREFGDKDAYIAYCRAKSAGLIKIGKTVQEVDQ